ncbi:hypothetical protein LTS08_005619 [Lithohypha guttulata]|nr:hypothetical protein LTR51_003210 [Lithohypha guttulata]KAK5099904.1 hypothetical protein LTS08_005619 [Lithohypha guttulata]
MASLSLSAPVEFESGFARGPPRHARKHSRHPTAAAPLPAFTFNPGSPSSKQDAAEAEKENMKEMEGEPLDMGLGHMRRSSKPAPLPDFTFNPGADIPVQRTPSPSHPILEEMALNQQRVSKSARPAPLPAFTFNPSAPTGSTSPTKLEVSNESSNGTGHRRGGSEFVGGKADGVQLITTSPSKHETKPSGPPVSSSAYKGHTHRRSQAISISDIDTSDLIKQHALAKARNPSNPSTPQDGNFGFTRASPSHRYTPSTSRSPPESPQRGGSVSNYRPRTVDFSEKVDVIPRPLSMISSETERSNSTIRGHSVTNSFPPAETATARRPNTADASFLLSDATSIKAEELHPVPKRPFSASGSPAVSQSGTLPPRKKHSWFPYGPDTTPTHTPKEEISNPFAFDSVDSRPAIDNAQTRTKTGSRRPSSLKHHKFYTWSVGVFPKKSKPHFKKKSRRSPTPPNLFRRDSDTLKDVFDADNTVVLREDSPVSARKQMTLKQQLPAPAPPESPSTELSRPVLDLDVAMDPFVDDRRFSEDHVRSTTARIAKLHSSERRATVDAFGVSHRRTESAPALSPVNRSALFGMRHQNSNASLSEDVFDEQEEDNFLAHEEEVKLHSNHQSTTSVNLPVPTEIEGGLGLSNIPSRVDGVVIVDSDNEVDADDICSSKSTIGAPNMTVGSLPKRPATSPMPFTYPNPQSLYASSTEGRTTSASLISSPDVDHASFDLQARSRRFESHTDSVRPSTEDLPSLSDSASSNAFTRASSSGRVRPSLEQRSNSMFVPGSSRIHENWKRSSLASLNRLIPGSSHGSKLRLEQVSCGDEEKTKKKTNRLSKLMKFWRSKESESKANT